MLPRIDEPILFKEHTAEELHALLAPHGVSAGWRVVCKPPSCSAAASPNSMPEVPRAPARNGAPGRRASRSLTLIEKVVSPTDGFAKYLFRGDGPETFEAVRIPLLHRPGDEKYVRVRVVAGRLRDGLRLLRHRPHGLSAATWRRGRSSIRSMQVRGRFAASGARRGLHGHGGADAQLRARHAGARVMSDPCGLAIDARAITISTVGIVPMIRRFTAERRPYRLIVSLTSVDPAQRRQLLPVENTHPLSELMAARARVSRGHRQARDPGLDHDGRRQHAAGGCTPPGGTDGRAAGADRSHRRERCQRRVFAAAAGGIASRSATR